MFEMGRKKRSLSRISSPCRFYEEPNLISGEKSLNRNNSPYQSSLAIHQILKLTLAAEKESICAGLRSTIAYSVFALVPHAVM